MKVLVATTLTQGIRKSDFCFVPEGELVNEGIVCGCGKGCQIDGGCGCQRSMSGLKCHKGTTTFKVLNIHLSMKEYAAKLKASHEAAGWGELEDEVATSAAERLQALAEGFRDGDILERRAEQLTVRVAKTEILRSAITDDYLDERCSEEDVSDETLRDFKTNNRLRIDRAIAAADAWRGKESANEGMETLLSDMLADVMHLCRVSEVSFEESLRRGRDHHDEERDGIH